MPMFSRKKEAKYTAAEIMLGINILNQVNMPLRFLYQIFEENNRDPFAIMLISALHTDLGELVRAQKRESDMLFEVDKGENIYAIICQDTKVDGGYYLINRLSRYIYGDQGSDFIATVVEIVNTDHRPEEVVLKLLDTYLAVKKDGHSRENIFHILR